MKALILAGGRGKRLDDLSANRNKCMIEVGGRPAIQYSLDCAVATDSAEILVVVGYRAEEIINHYGNGYRGRPVKYVIQPEQRGLVHAIECARPALGGDDFLLLLGDEIMHEPRHQAMIDTFRRDGVFGYCGVLTVADRALIKRTYTLIQSPERVIYRLVEKPRNPLNDLMGTGDCVFKNAILDYIDVTPVHHQRSEKELPDLIQCAIDDGRIVKSFPICDRYVNINSRDDIAMAEAFFA
jgi:UDP-N-acetylglucosamine diphosphorylase / glucose-1-phosphate thymidylyltransferase / UDP-N-acetylgalactosamine diphosphorylase / glucosamine-1-phosphate N-acetyltransferase / galactosamine-1-phosphate N-acetyltransferase